VKGFWAMAKKYALTPREMMDELAAILDRPDETRHERAGMLQQELTRSRNRPPKHDPDIAKILAVVQKERREAGD